jgi:histidine triad (HIT) family protein
MPSAFTQIINGQIPARFVWKDERVVAFLSIAPITPGHVLVVPRAEIDQWTDLPTDLRDHLMAVSAHVGTAVKQAFAAPRAGLVIAGFEIPHAHIHVFPARDLTDFDFTKANINTPAADLDDAHTRINAALSTLGNPR